MPRYSTLAVAHFTLLGMNFPESLGHSQGTIDSDLNVSTLIRLPDSLIKVIIPEVCVPFQSYSRVLRETMQRVLSCTIKKVAGSEASMMIADRWSVRLWDVIRPHLLRRVPLVIILNSASMKQSRGN